MGAAADAHEKRAGLRAALQGGSPLRFPGAFSPLVALVAERLGFEGVYVSGAGVANDLGRPDTGLTTLTEVAQRGRAIAGVVDLPAIIDLDTGFGGPPNVTRAVREVEDFGLAGCHIEDQVDSKRCGHLGGKELIDCASMVAKIKAAALAKRDPDFIIIARTDARGPEGMESAVARAKAYVDAGAEMIFPEALESEGEFERFREEINVPLIANMTEFGRSPLLGYGRLRDLGYNVILYPLTALRLALKAVELGLAALLSEGTQEHLVESMLTRVELYELLSYEAYGQPHANARRSEASGELDVTSRLSKELT
jgi:methylisocitrate lyase